MKDIKPTLKAATEALIAVREAIATIPYVGEDFVLAEIKDNLVHAEEDLSKAVDDLKRKHIEQIREAPF